MTTPKSWYKNFLYDEKRDTPGDVRNLLLVVVTLIAAVTFQAGVNPPGGVWQDNQQGRAGKAIYASQPTEFYVFLISNTIALCTSILVIISLTPGYPFYLEIVTATFSMLVTYASAITAVTPKRAPSPPISAPSTPISAPSPSPSSDDDYVQFQYVLTAGALPFIVRVLIHLFHKCKNQWKTRGKTGDKTSENIMGDGNATDNA